MQRQLAASLVIFVMVVVLLIALIGAFYTTTATEQKPQWSATPYVVCKSQNNGIYTVYAGLNASKSGLWVWSSFSGPVDGYADFQGGDPRHSLIITQQGSKQLFGVLLQDGHFNPAPDEKFVWTIAYFNEFGKHVTRSVKLDKNAPDCNPVVSKPQAAEPQYFGFNHILIWSVEGTLFTWEVQDDLGTWHPVVDDYGNTLYTPVEYRWKFNDATGQNEYTAITRLPVFLDQPTDASRYRVTNELGVITGVWKDFNNYGY